MKIVVIGGTGLIGSKVVQMLGAQGREAVAASPNSGVDTITGAGLAEVLTGAAVVVDVSNSPSFEDEPAMKFFQTSTRNLLATEAAAGVGHHVALSVVGTDRLSESGAATDGDTVHLAHVLIQPMAADDVASAVAGVAVGAPVNGIIEVAGPEQFPLDAFIERGLRARNDPRKVVADPQSRYFGAALGERTLVPEGGARLAKTRFDDWLRESTR